MFKGCSFSPHIDENGEYEGPAQKHMNVYNMFGTRSNWNIHRGPIRNEKYIRARHQTIKQVFGNCFQNKDLLPNNTLSAYIKEMIWHGTIQYLVDHKS